MTFAAFAEALGVSLASVYRWESITGVLSLKPSTIRVLEEFCR